MHVPILPRFMFCRSGVRLQGCSFSKFLGKVEGPFLGTALGEPLDEDSGSLFSGVRVTWEVLSSAHAWAWVCAFQVTLGNSIRASWSLHPFLLNVSLEDSCCEAFCCCCCFNFSFLRVEKRPLSSEGWLVFVQVVEYL